MFVNGKTEYCVDDKAGIYDVKWAGHIVTLRQHQHLEL